MNNGVFGLPVPQGTTIVGFADDLTGTVVETVRALMSWLAGAELTLVDAKVEAALITNHQKKITVKVGGYTFVSKPIMKYMGVIIDATLNFSEYLISVDILTKEMTTIYHARENTGMRRGQSHMIFGNADDTNIRRVFGHTGPSLTLWYGSSGNMGRPTIILLSFSQNTVNSTSGFVLGWVIDRVVLDAVTYRRFQSMLCFTTQSSQERGRI